eukprot:403340947
MRDVGYHSNKDHNFLRIVSSSHQNSSQSSPGVRKLQENGVGNLNNGSRADQKEKSYKRLKQLRNPQFQQRNRNSVIDEDQLLVQSIKSNQQLLGIGKMEGQSNTSQKVDSSLSNYHTNMLQRRKSIQQSNTRPQSVANVNSYTNQSKLTPNQQSIYGNAQKDQANNYSQATTSHHRKHNSMNNFNFNNHDNGFKQAFENQDNKQQPIYLGQLLGSIQLQSSATSLKSLNQKFEQILCQDSNQPSLPRLSTNPFVHRVIGNFVKHRQDYQPSSNTQSFEKVNLDYGIFQQSLKLVDHNKFVNKLRKIRSNQASPQNRYGQYQDNINDCEVKEFEIKNEGVHQDNNQQECYIAGMKIKPKIKINLNNKHRNGLFQPYKRDDTGKSSVFSANQPLFNLKNKGQKDSSLKQLQFSSGQSHSEVRDQGLGVQTPTCLNINLPVFNDTENTLDDQECRLKELNKIPNINSYQVFTQNKENIKLSDQIRANEQEDDDICVISDFGKLNEETTPIMSMMMHKYNSSFYTSTNQAQNINNINTVNTLNQSSTTKNANQENEKHGQIKDFELESGKHGGNITVKKSSKQVMTQQQNQSPIKKWLREEKYHFQGIKVEITKNQKKI